MFEPLSQRYVLSFPAIIITAIITLIITLYESPRVLRSLVQTMGIGHYGTMGTPKPLKFDWADPQQLLLLPLHEGGTNKATMAGKKLCG